MNSPRKVLLIDNAPDRKERIKALRERGYNVFPALKMDEARSRCMRGAYDLVLVHADAQPEQAMQFCDEIRKQCPKQLLLMSSRNAGERDYTVGADIPTLVQRVDRLLQNEGQSTNLANAA
jgi:DNA-binding response OmpR family regulator